jgi:transposase
MKNNTKIDYSQAKKTELLDVITQKNQQLSKQANRITILEEALRAARHKRFAPSSEKSDEPSLFNEAELEALNTDTVESERPVSNDISFDVQLKKKKPGRQPFSKKLPRTPIFIDLTADEKKGAIDTFYTKVKEELDIIPAKVQILEYFQEKAVFKQTNANNSNGTERLIKTAIMPKHPLAKSMGSINLMAHVIISKYADGLPLYRLEGILSRYGGDITRATLSRWIIKLSKQLQPLINLMREQQCRYDIIQMDETVLKVLKEPAMSATSNKYMWVSRGGPPECPSVLFEYDPSRKKEVPLRLLGDFNGYLQTDGYAAYNALCVENNATSVGCWDHARRKFKEAQNAQPTGKKNKPSKADMALAQINKLYQIERTIKEATAPERYKIRQEKSLPVLNKLRAWVDTNRPKVLKDSLTGKALVYLDNQWDKLQVYCEDGRLNISNVLAENAIRPFVIGRKAWLFSDTPNGANASAVHYSFIETAKVNNIEPYAYLVAVLKNLPYADTVEKLEALLPWNFKKGLLVVGSDAGN